MTDFLLTDIKQFCLCYKGWENKNKARPDALTFYYTLGMKGTTVLGGKPKKA